MQIVLARLDQTQEIAKQGRIDLGERHTFRTVNVPVACIWLNDGSEDDVQSATRYAAREGYSVLCYKNEADPLARARKDIAR